MSNWHECVYVKVISKENKTLLDRYANKYRLDSNWVFIEDLYGEIHIFPKDTITRLIIS